MARVPRQLRILRDVLRAAPDLIAAGIVSHDPSQLRAELLSWHRVRARDFIAEALPKGGVGIELGVYTGMFSTRLLRITRPRRAYFVDLWWKGFGAVFPDWGAYTDHGRLPTRVAYESACRRIERFSRGAETQVVVSDAVGFLATLPDAGLDWAYVDTSHEYAETRELLEALAPKMTPGGVIAGDDWCDDPGHVHFGGTVALRELLDAGLIELIAEPRQGQWLARPTQGI